MTNILTEAPAPQTRTASYCLNTKKILVAVDLSPDSEETAFYAARLAKRLEAYVSLVHVCLPKQNTEFTSKKDSRFDDPLLVSEEKLENLAKKIRKFYPSCCAHLCVGDPANTLALMADILEADLILMGAHDSSFLGKFVGVDKSLGIMHHAPCPVLFYQDTTKRL
jgi:nucleotide-binding universal stress UspA family protein